MKTARYLVPTFLAALGFIVLRADDNPSVDDSSMWIDPDAVPKSFVPDKPEPTPEQRAAEKKLQKKAADDRNWMMRGYQQQLEAKAKGGSKDESDSDMAETAALARAAGLSVTEYSDLQSSEDAASAESTTRTPEHQAQPRTSSAAIGAYNPFKPLLSTDAPSASVPFASPSPLLAPGGSSNTTLTLDQTSMNEASNRDSGDMDIPGMTAAQSSAATKDAMGMSESDLLPGESQSAYEKSHHDLELELPLARNSDQLAKMQSDAMALPGASPKKPTSAAPAPPPPIEPPSATSEMVHDPSPLRAHVDDPFDILR